MNLQEEYNKMPAPLQQVIRGSKEKDLMLLLYIIESQYDKTQQVLEVAGVPNPKPCKKCYGRYIEGFKYPDARVVAGELVRGREVVVLCNCVHKQLEKIKKLNVEWEVINGKE